MFTSEDVLKRALRIVRRGPLPATHSEHGEWCPYCALSLAKDQLDKQHGTDISFGECLREVVYGITIHPSDAPLVEARKLIGKLKAPFTKDATIEAIRGAMKRRKGR